MVVVVVVAVTGDDISKLVRWLGSSWVMMTDALGGII